MDKENPFIVPEGFFEDARSRIMAGAEKVHHRRSRMAIGISSLAATIAIIVGAQFAHNVFNSEELLSEAEAWTCIYDYDIFLQIDE